MLGMDKILDMHPWDNTVRGSQFASEGWYILEGQLVGGRGLEIRC